MITVDALADAIYTAEGGKDTKWPYGIKQHYVTTTPRQACINTIIHAERTYKVVEIDRHFIYLLADIYCPPKVDLVGNQRWKVNVVRILHL